MNYPTYLSVDHDDGLIYIHTKDKLRQKFSNIPCFSQVLDDDGILFVAK